VAGRVSDISRLGLAVAGMVAAALPVCGHAQQKSEENAVTSSDDAFGNSVGLEATGLYNQYNVRGFSPTDAGNARVDGIYIDPVSLITLRVKTSQAIRVGYAALEYPFAAPTGILDTQLRTARNDFHAGLEAHRQQYGSYVFILDSQIPLIEDHLSLAAGISHGHGKQIDGASENNYSFAVKPVIRMPGVEISPFYSVNYVRDARPRPLVLMERNFHRLPPFPKAKRYFGSRWAQGSKDNVNFGGTVKARIAEGLSLRAGLFKSQELRRKNFTDIFRVRDAAGNADHIFLADPRHDRYSWSGEALLGYRFGKDRWHHRLMAGFRMRDRSTEFGGSQCFDFGDAVLGVPDTGFDTAAWPPGSGCRADARPDVEPQLSFSPTSNSKVTQKGFMAGYIGKFDGVGLVNLGIQRSIFRARTVTGSGTASGTDAEEWLYNASLGVEITPNLLLYAGTQRGLEDIGSAPETAANRGEHLPAVLSRQHEAGLRWKFGKHVLLIGVFEITKPYFSFDAANRYVRLGDEKHTGIEASFSGHFAGDRLTVLAGFVVFDPVVDGPGRDLGILGRTPVGIRGTRGRVDLEYRTDLWGGLTPTLTLEYRGSTSAAAEPIPGTDEQVQLGSHLSIDIGLRQPLRIGRIPATIRLKAEDLLNQNRWLAPASRTLFQGDKRRFSVSLLVDF
jgi:iron complex outermembrane recepter protein